MIKEIVKDVEFLQIPSTKLNPDELYVIEDLIDTIKAHSDTCVGMAANMIGYSKNAIVVVLDSKEILPMINPTYIFQKEPYKTKEGCLSLTGVRPCLRYKKIKVSYFDMNFKNKIKTFYDWEAEIIQHEMDHLMGKII